MKCVVLAALAILVPGSTFADNITWNYRGTMSPASGWKFAAGNFAADALADVAGYQASNGQIHVGLNTGSSISFTHWANVPVSGTWTTIRAADFSGDGRADLLMYRSEDGSVWMGRNTGSGFTFTRWATMSPAGAMWRFEIGDFSGTSRPDFVAYHALYGYLIVGRNTGVSFALQSWGSMSPNRGWTIHAGNFSREGKTDLAAYRDDDGIVRIGRNTGVLFSFSDGFQFGPAAGWTLVPGKFSQDGADDLGAHFDGDGTFWVGRSTLSGEFQYSRPVWGIVSPPSGWSFVAANFTSAIPEDLFAYYPNDGSIWIGDNSGVTPGAYAWPLSAQPGQTISIYASGILEPSAEVARHVRSGDSIIGLPEMSIGFGPAVQPYATPRVVQGGAGWSPSFSVTIGADWVPGYYSARVRSAITGEVAYATFIVRRSSANRSDVALIANVNTWLAYNPWGGSNKYGGTALNSFLRPNPNAEPVGPWSPSDHLARAEVFFSSWLEERGVLVDLYTDVDLHFGLPSGYDKLILSTHPEYFTTAMYDNLEAFLNQGGSLIYVGGNGIFERAHYETTDGSLVSYLRGYDDPSMRTYETWRMLGRHEISLLGVATADCTASERAFRTLAPEHSIFAGTDLTAGATFGYGASAHEIDTSYSSDAHRIPCGIWNSPDPQPVVPFFSVPPVVVLASADDLSDRGAHMTFYRHAGGGFVFSAGSITFGHTLSQSVPGSALPVLMGNVLNIQ